MCVADGERQFIPGYGALRGERSLARVFLFEQRIPSLRVSAVDGKVRDGL